VVLLLLLSLRAPSLLSQRIIVSTIDTKDFPTVRGEVYVVGPDGKEITDLSASDMVVTENGERRQVISLTCPESPRPQMISSVLTIDVSGSMEKGAQGGITPNIDLARAAANAWVDGLPTDGSSCALTTFDSRGLIHRDFTHDRALLRSSIATLRPQGGTDYNAGLLEAPNGALSVIGAGRGRRVIVFLTDGLGGGHEAKIVEAARGLNASIFCVTLGMPAPDILRSIADRTGGACYENVTTVEEAQAIYRAILFRATGGRPCVLEWRSAGSCDGRRGLGLSVPTRNLSGISTYMVPPETMPGLRVEPAVLFFGKVPAGERREMMASIVAVNKPVTVTGVQASTTSPVMTIDGLEAPFTLQPGERKTLRVSYAPTNDRPTSVRWRIANDGCTGGLLLGTSSGNRRNDPSIHLIVPNGGERFRPGETTTLRWDGVVPETPVRLDYSTNAGRTWMGIVAMASGGRYDWVVPGTPSEQCYARVSELSTRDGSIPPIIGDSSARQRSINSIALSPDGTKIITAAGQDEGRIVVWNTTDGAMVMELRNRDIRNNSGLKPQVYYAGFSADGSRIITANYGRVVGSTTYVEQYIELFDASNGRPIASFKGTLANGSMWVGGVQTPDHRATGDNNRMPVATPFGPDGSTFIAIVDSLPVLFDATTGRVLRKIQAPVATVRSVRYSPDGRMVATAGVDGAARLFDAATGVELKRFEHDGMVMQVDFSPDGSMLGTSCGDDTVRIFDVRTGRMTTSIAAAKRAPDHQPNAFVFSPGGDRLLVANWGRMIPALYSLPDGALIRTYTEIDEGEKYPARQVIGNFSADGALLVFTGEHRADDNDGYRARVVDVATGTIVAQSVVERVSHNASYGLITPDGSAVVTGGGGVPIIQPLAGGSVQQDRSDGLWAIIEAIPAAIDVDFGRQLVGSATDSIIGPLVTNRGTDTLLLGDITLGGDGADDFGVVSQPYPSSVPPGGTATAELRFRPTAVGPRSTTMLIQAGGKTWRQSITGEGIAPQLRVGAQTIDFGDVIVGAERDTTIALLLRNEGSRPLQLGEIVTMGPDTSRFVVLDRRAITIPPGGVESMSFRFTPDTIGRRSTRLLIRHDGIGGTETLDLSGRGVVPPRERMWHDPTTFRSIAIPNAIIPKKGSVVLGSYDIVGLMAGFALTDNLMLIAGGAAPLPDDWGGVNAQMYGAWSLGVKGGLWLFDEFNVGGGFQYAASVYDREETPETESSISIASPYLAVSYGDDDRRVSATFGYAFKHHTRLVTGTTIIDEFDRNASILGIGGDYRFASRWKVAAEVLTMETLGFLPIAATVRYFGDTWAIDAGIGYVGIVTDGGDSPETPIVPVVSWVVVL